MDAGGVADGESHLVGLEVSDEVPFDVVGEQGRLLGELLWPVLSEGAESGVVCLADVGDGEGLGDGEEPCAVEGASGAFERVADACLDDEDVGGDVGHGWVSSVGEGVGLCGVCPLEIMVIKYIFKRQKGEPAAPQSGGFGEFGMSE